MKLNWLLWLIVAIILYRQVIPLANLVKYFPLNDFSVYIDGAKTVLDGENPYKLKFFDRYNYSPAATLFFVPLASLPIELSEWLFTILSVVSVWLTVSWILRILDWEPDRVVKWLIFAASLKMFPVKLTLVLGQINLIVLALIVGSYYFVKIRKRDTVSGILFGLATILKLTPLPLLIYFLLRKKWKAIWWFGATVAALTAAGGLIFGWGLTEYYFKTVLPSLMGEVTKATVNASYMNQSITALMARFGVFGNLNSAIRLGISFILGIKVIKIIKAINEEEKTKEFVAFWNLAIIALLFLPVFVWQHHYVFLLPAWIVLLNIAVKNKRLFDWIVVGISYGSLNFYFHDANWLSGKNPLMISHFLVLGVIMWLLMMRLNLD